MDEIGGTIVTDPAAMQFKRGVPHDRGWNSGQTNVDGFCLHVEAVLGDARVRVSVPQILVAPRRAVSTDDINLAIAVMKRSGQVVKQVEQARIKVVDITGAMIPKKAIQLRQGLLRVGVAPAIYEVESLAGVGMIEAQPIFRNRFAGI